MSTVVRVARLRESPVKGLAQAEVKHLELTMDGIRTDRRFVCTDDKDRRLYSPELGALARARAEWDERAATLTVTFPDGSVVSGSIALRGKERSLVTPSGRLMLGTPVAGPFAAAMSEAAGRTIRLYQVPVGHGAPGAVTILGDGSLARLARELGLAHLDPKRFKMSIELDGLRDSEEDGWGGRMVHIGEALLEIGSGVPRCVLTTQDPDTGLRDHDTLKVLLGYRDALPTGEPPFGVYATVVEPGTVKVGDPVEVRG